MLLYDVYARCSGSCRMGLATRSDRHDVMLSVCHGGEGGCICNMYSSPCNYVYFFSSAGGGGGGGTGLNSSGLLGAWPSPICSQGESASKFLYEGKGDGHTLFVRVRRRGKWKRTGTPG